MQSFKITLPNNAVLTGIHNLLPSTVPNRTPLIVALHGGTYTAKYFDVDTNHTASIASNGLGVPFVAINRPGYKESTSFYPIPDGSSYPEEFGTWLHQFILPAVWSEFGKPSGCNCIVLHCHSLGTTGAIIAASMHAKETNKSYPLAGISTSGFGSRIGVAFSSPHEPGASQSTPVLFPPEVKDSLMLQEGHADPEIYKHTAGLNHEMPGEEISSVESVWFSKWTVWAEAVEVPIMIGLAGHDLMWKGTEEHLKDYISNFTKSERVDSSIVTGAPHNMELSYWAKGWYARCFGFASECAAGFAQKQ
jgi:hypothetical protein